MALDPIFPSHIPHLSEIKQFSTLNQMEPILNHMENHIKSHETHMKSISNPHGKPWFMADPTYKPQLPRSQPTESTESTTNPGHKSRPGTSATKKTSRPHALLGYVALEMGFPPIFSPIKTWFFIGKWIMFFLGGKKLKWMNMMIHQFRGICSNNAHIKKAIHRY